MGVLYAYHGLNARGDLWGDMRLQALFSERIMNVFRNLNALVRYFPVLQPSLPEIYSLSTP